MDHSGMTILLVEDEVIIALEESETLQRYGFNVITASHGEEAVRIAADNENIHLILMDIDLGRGIDGTQAAAQILKERDIPVVFLSSHAEPEVVEKTEKITSYGYILKNSAETVLIAAIKMAFKLYASNRAMKEREVELNANDARLQSLVSILQHPSQSVQEFLDFALSEALKLTSSKLGYIYFFHEDRQEFVLNTWSKDVMKECQVANPQTCYALDKTGIWGEVVRQRKPIILNNYAEENPLKKGYPQGHAALYTFMSIPVFSENKIVAVVGVANKDKDYTDKDILQLTLLMDSVWKVVSRRSAENALKESEHKFRELYDLSPACIAIVDLEARFIHCNQSFCSFTGYTTQELSGKHVSEITHPDDLSIGLPELRRVISGELDKIHIVKRYIRKNGNIVWGEGTTRIQRSISGEPLNFIATLHDITETKHAEKSILDSTASLASIFESTHDAIFIHDAETGRIIDINKNACDMYGYSREEFLSAKSIEVENEKPSHTLKDRMAMFDKTRNEGNQVFEWLAQHKDGHFFWVEVSLHYSLINGQYRFIAAIRDITERKNIENNLKENEARLAAFMENIPSMIIIKDSDLRLIYANNRFRQFFHADDWMGKLPHETFPKEIADLMVEKDTEALNKGFVTYEEEWTDKNGKMHSYQTHKFRISLPDDRSLLGVLISDISELKDKEQLLRQKDYIFESFLEHSPVYVFFKDHEIRPTNLSKNYEQMLGMPLENILGKTMDELFPSEMARSMIDDDKRILDEGKLVKVDEELNGRYFTTIKFPIHPPGSQSMLAGFTLDITETTLAQKELSAALEEKERLLRELQHRVKNSLAMIASMIGLETSRSTNTEVKETITRIRDRVTSVASLYDMLYKTGDTQAIRLDLYFLEVIKSLLDSYVEEKERITSRTSLQELTIDVKRAAVLGLILNECITNTFKYAFPGGRHGVITVILNHVQNRVELTIRDDGIGLPENFNIKNSSQLGMQLISMLTEQLGGTSQWSGTGGTTFAMTFPL